MLQLTPLEKTVAGQELIRIGLQQGEKKSLSKGELIGEIRAMQKFLGQPVTPVNKLVMMSLKDLKRILQQLETELN